MAFSRTLAVLAAASALVAAACGHGGTRTGSSSTAGPPATPAPAAAPPLCADPTAVPGALSDREKLAQLLMVGVRNAADAKAVVTNYHVGGIMIGGDTDLSMFTDGALAQLAGGAGPLPLAVSVDEEGGRVSRLKSLIGKSPSARVLAQTQTVDQVYNMARERGRQMKDLVADDLVPYRTLVTQAPVGVMIGHLQVPGLTGDQPASLSKAAVDLLRTGTGYGGPPFDGPVFSDDLSSMAAISDRYGVPDAVLLSLQAGTDIALWVTTAEVPAVLDRLDKALAAGELTTPAIDRSVVRVATMKGRNRGCGR